MNKHVQCTIINKRCEKSLDGEKMQKINAQQKHGIMPGLLPHRQWKVQNEKKKHWNHYNRTHLLISTVIRKRIYNLIGLDSSTSEYLRVVSYNPNPNCSIQCHPNRRILISNHNFPLCGKQKKNSIVRPDWHKHIIKTRVKPDTITCSGAPPSKRNREVTDLNYADHEYATLTLERELLCHQYHGSAGTSNQHLCIPGLDFHSKYLQYT